MPRIADRFRRSSSPQQETDARPPHLTRSQRKRIDAAIARANRSDRKETSAQESIPYERMWPDGICRVAAQYYTKTIQFLDINYQLNQDEDKTAIFEGWGDFLNYFDSSIHFQLSFLNLPVEQEAVTRSLRVTLQGDEFDEIRREYLSILKAQVSQGSRGLQKTKYLTFGIEAESIRTAKPRLDRIETDILGNFKRLGVTAFPLNGKERLGLMHDLFHMDAPRPFSFDWKWLPAGGTSTKDYIAPSSFVFRTGRRFSMGNLQGAVSFLQILGIPGSGKSFAAKREIANVFMMTDDDFAIVDQKNTPMPILGDLYDLLRQQPEPDAQVLATALEIYVNGSLNVFNHRTNVDVKSRLVCYDIKDLGKQLKKLGMLIMQDAIWNRVTVNRYAHKNTRVYIDELHLLLREEQTAAYSVEIWKRFRKWGGIPTGITQNVKDLLSSREVENIFENSDFVLMMNQAGGDRQILAKQLNISPHQLSYVTHSGEGEGLLFYGNVIVPFVDRFPKDTELYRVLTTKPQEMEYVLASDGSKA